MYFSITSQKDFVDLGGWKSSNCMLRIKLPRVHFIKFLTRVTSTQSFPFIFFSFFVFFFLKFLSIPKSNLSTITKYFSTESECRTHIHTHEKKRCAVQSLMQDSLDSFRVKSIFFIYPWILPFSRLILKKRLKKLTSLPTPERYSLAESFRLWEGHLTLVDLVEYNLALPLADGDRSIHNHNLVLLRLLWLLLLLRLLLLTTRVGLLCVRRIIRILISCRLTVLLVDRTVTL